MKKLLILSILLLSLVSCSPIDEGPNYPFYNTVWTYNNDDIGYWELSFFSDDTAFLRTSKYGSAQGTFKRQPNQDIIFFTNMCLGTPGTIGALKVSYAVMETNDDMYLYLTAYDNKDYYVLLHH